MRSPHDLERPEAEREETEEAEGGQSDDSDAHEKAGAAVKVGRGDRDRLNAESSRNADTAPSARGVGNEVAQRRRSESALGTSRPLRRTLCGSLCSVGTGAIAFVALRMPAS
jgi:hypothetical protein